VINIEKIEHLLKLMAQYGVENIQAQSGNESIILSKYAVPSGGVSHGVGSGAPAQAPKASQQGGEDGPRSTTTPPAETAPVASALPEGTQVCSPFVGTFYRSSSPDAPSFVDVGSSVRRGQTLCIVEAMKIMNEIEAEQEGEVVAILVKNGQPVEFNTPLFVIR